MKWKSKCKRIGDTRVVKRFLLFPRHINEEARWLETVLITQVVRDVPSGGYDNNLEWCDVRFEN
jgi:hypothetical protein